MTSRIIGATRAAAILAATCMSVTPASSAPVNRPLADELTRQFNQKELEQLQSGSGTYSQPGAAPLSRQQLDQPGTMLPPAPGSRAPGEWPYAPR